MKSNSVNISYNACMNRLSEMESRMRTEGKSPATISKYMRDAKHYIEFISRDADACKEPAMCIAEYRSYLAQNYKISSANSMIAGANYFLDVCEPEGRRIKTIRVQKELFRDDERELSKAEYCRLLCQAKADGRIRIYHIMQTLGSTGIRISELRFITVEAVQRGKAIVSLKGKTREVLLPGKLCDQLSEYAEERNIESGSIFITRNGGAIDRSNVLHEMKKIADRSGVDRRKVYPHNFRHLFAVLYYQAEKDVCHLADILGHSSIETTRIYTARRRSDMMRSIEGLNLI